MHNFILASAIALSMYTCGNTETGTTKIDTLTGENLKSPTDVSDTLRLIADTAGIDRMLLEPLTPDKVAGNWLNLTDFSEGGADPESPGTSFSFHKNGVVIIVQNHTEYSGKWSLEGHVLSIENGGKITRFMVGYTSPLTSKSQGTYMYLFREDRDYFGILSSDVEP